jgi:hypothetical protein
MDGDFFALQVDRVVPAGGMKSVAAKLRQARETRYCGAVQRPHSQHHDTGCEYRTSIGYQPPHPHRFVEPCGFQADPQRHVRSQIITLNARVKVFFDL